MVFKTAFPFASVAFGGSIKTGLEIHGTTFFDCRNMSRIFWSMLLVPRMLTASSSTMWHVAFVNEFLILRGKPILQLTSTESLEADRRCKFSTAYRWTVQFSGKKAIAIKFC